MSISVKRWNGHLVKKWKLRGLTVLAVLVVAYLYAWAQTQFPPLLVIVALLGVSLVLWMLVDDFKHLALLYIPLVLFAPSLFRDLEFVSSGVRADQMILLVVVVLLILRSLLTGRIRLPKTLALLYFAYLASATVTVLLNSSSGSDSNSFLLDLVGIQGLARPFVVFLAFSLILREEWQVKQVVTLILVSGAVMVVFATLQFARVDPVVDLTVEYFDRKISPVVLGGRGPVVGTFEGLHNSLALFLVLFISLALALVWNSRRVLTASQRYIVMALAGLAFVPLLGTLSRTGLVAVVAAIATLLVLHLRSNLGRRSIYVFGFLILTLVAAIVAVSFVEYTRDRFIGELLSLDVIFNDPRYTLLTPSLLDIIVSNPIFGRGFDLGTASDIGYLIELAARGIVGFTLFFAMIAYIIFAALDVLRLSSDGIYAPLAAAILATTVGFLVASLANSAFWSVRTVEFYWLLVACLMFARRSLYIEAYTKASSQQS